MSRVSLACEPLVHSVSRTHHPRLMCMNRLAYSIESMAAEFQFVVGKPIIYYVGIYSSFFQTWCRNVVIVYRLILFVAAN